MAPSPFFWSLLGPIAHFNHSFGEQPDQYMSSSATVTTTVTTSATALIPTLQPIFSTSTYPFEGTDLSIMTSTLSHLPTDISVAPVYLPTSRPILNISNSPIEPVQEKQDQETQDESYWSGWSNIQNWFAFGDSYSTTRFNERRTQPNARNPLGNPAFPGKSSCNGLNYLAQLSTIYNESSVMFYNIAYGGATVNGTRTRQLYDVIPSGVEQVHYTWYNRYSLEKTRIPWTSNDTLFSFWFGVNDMISTMNFYDAEVMLPLIITDYRALLDFVYAHGARNFLVLNCPSFELSPAIQILGPKMVRRYRRQIISFNAQVAAMVADFTAVHTDTKVFLLDTYALFKGALEDPTMYPETAEIRNTTNVCRPYVKSDSAADYPRCHIPALQYFWHDNLHPSQTVHKLVARSVVDLLRG